MTEVRRKPVDVPDIIAAEHIIASARNKSKDWTNVYLVPIEQYCTMAKQAEQAEQQVARLEGEIERLKANQRREPSDNETVCHACDGSGWIDR